jgi:acetolactate synthase small subunit
MKHIIAVLLENEPGALSRVVGLFSARGYNIESLTVAPTEDPSLSRMTIQTAGSDDVIEQITKHLNRLIEVVKVATSPRTTHSSKPSIAAPSSRRSARVRAASAAASGSCASRRSPQKPSTDS